MSAILKRIEIPIALTIIAVLVQVIPYYVHPMFVPGLEAVATDISVWVVILISWATFVGVISLAQVHGVTIQKRGKGWYFSAIVIGGAVVMAIAGLPLREVGLGTTNPVYNWLYNNGNVPLGQAMYAVLAFFMTSGAYRAFRAKNIEAGLVLISGSVIIMFNAPAISALLPDLAFWRNWLFDVPNMATMRAVIIGGALGAIALAVRTLMGIERGYLKGGSD